MLVSNLVALTKRITMHLVQEVQIFQSIIVNLSCQFWSWLSACNVFYIVPFSMHLAFLLISYWITQSFQVSLNIPHSCQDAVLHLEGPHQAWAWWVPLRDPGYWPNRGGHWSPPGAGSLKLVLPMKGPVEGLGTSARFKIYYQSMMLLHIIVNRFHVSISFSRGAWL